MKLSEIKDILSATILFGEDQLDTDIFAGGAADLMDDVLQATAKGAVLLTGQTSVDVLRICTIMDIGAVVFVRGKKPDEDVLDLARSYNIPVLSTNRSLFVSCGRLYMNGLRGLDGYW
jgi:predicted transcriptional regulator